MPTIRRLILDNLKTTLLSVTPANGYTNDLTGRVFHWEDPLQVNADVPKILIALLSESLSNRNAPFRESDLEGEIEIKVAKSPTEAPDGIEQLQVLGAEITKALNVDVTRGNPGPGACWDTKVEQWEIKEVGADDAFLTATLSLRIPYRCRWDDLSVYP